MAAGIKRRKGRTVAERIDVYSTNGDGCWEWLGAKTAGGYGLINVNGRHTTAQRAAYEAVHGPQPAHLVIDHLCRNRSCVRVDHLEAVTSAENMRRGEHDAAVALRTGICINGHARTSIYVHNGKQLCRQCRAEAARRFRRSHVRAR